jgi:hypothetical protein
MAVIGHAVTVTRLGPQAVMHKARGGMDPFAGASADAVSDQSSLINDC